MLEYFWHRQPTAVIFYAHRWLKDLRGNWKDWGGQLISLSVRKGQETRDTEGQATCYIKCVVFPVIFRISWFVHQIYGVHNSQLSYEPWLWSNDCQYFCSFKPRLIQKSISISCIVCTDGTTPAASLHHLCACSIVSGCNPLFSKINVPFAKLNPGGVARWFWLAPATWIQVLCCLAAFNPGPFSFLQHRAFYSVAPGYKYGLRQPRHIFPRK